MQEKIDIEETNNKLDNEKPLNDILESEEFQRMYAKMHTPWKRRYEKVNRNSICPFCSSGKKFKNCECYEKYKNTPIYTL